MTDAQAALAQVREALADPMLFDWARDWDRARAIRVFERSCTTANIAAIIAHVDAQAAENEHLREMLAHLYAGSALYCDDGELQDNRASPFIDFKRDSVADIRSAMVERGEQR